MFKLRSLVYYHFLFLFFIYTYVAVNKLSMLPQCLSLFNFFFSFDFFKQILLLNFFTRSLICSYLFLHLKKKLFFSLSFSPAHQSLSFFSLTISEYVCAIKLCFLTLCSIFYISIFSLRVI